MQKLSPKGRTALQKGPKEQNRNKPQVNTGKHETHYSFCIIPDSFCKKAIHYKEKR